MAKLLDLLERNKPCKVRRNLGPIYIWDGGDLYTICDDGGRINALFSSVFLFWNDWELVLTLEDVAKKNGWKQNMIDSRYFIKKSDTSVYIKFPPNKIITNEQLQKAIDAVEGR